LGEKRPKNFSEDVSVYGVSRGKKTRKSGNGKHVALVARSPQTPHSEVLDTDRSRESVIRYAGLVGAIWATLVAIDLVIGPRFWAHFPGIVLVTLLCLYASPLIVRHGFSLMFARGIVVAGGLLLINVATWSGYLCAMWPVGGILFIEIIRRLGFWKR